MRAIQIIFEFDKKPDKPLEFIPLGDMHVGGLGCDEGHIKKYVEYIRRTGAYWWGMGDYIEAINYSDPRFDPTSVADWMDIADMRNLPKIQAQRFLDLMAPIANRCLFVLHGNHEESVAKHSHFDVGQHIADSLLVPYLGYSGFVDLIFNYKPAGTKKGPSTSRRLFVHHGWGGGRMAGGKVNKVQGFLNGFDADDYFMGHVHDTVTLKTSRVGVKRCIGKLRITNPAIGASWRTSEVVSKDHCFGLTGTFLKGALYAEMQGYNPSFVGAIKYTVDPFWRAGSGQNKQSFTALTDIGTLTL